MIILFLVTTLIVALLLAIGKVYLYFHPYRIVHLKSKKFRVEKYCKYRLDYDQVGDIFDSYDFAAKFVVKLMEQEKILKKSRENEKNNKIVVKTTYFRKK